MNTRRRNDSSYLLYLLPFCLFFILFQIVPLVWVLTHSLLDAEGLSLQNFRTALGSAFYRQALYHSIWVSVCSSLAGLVIGLLGSYSLTRVQSRLRDFFLAFSNMVSNFSGVPLAFAFIIVLGVQGALTLMLQQMGLLQSFNLYSLSGLILVYTYFQIPLAILLLYPAFDALQTEWRESAWLLGANNTQYWRQIALPILMPQLLGTLVILLANALGAYATAYALTTGNFNLLPIRIGALVAGDLNLDPNLASALAVILLALMLLVTLTHQKLLKRSAYVAS